MPIDLHTVTVLGLAGPISTGVVTVIRLFERTRRKNFGYDDAFAALSLGGLMLFTIAIFIHFDDPSYLSQPGKAVVYYLIAQGFYATIWTARLSIMAMVMRLTTPRSRTRRVLCVLATSFIVLWAILAAQVFWVCDRKPLWKDTQRPQCPLGMEVAIAQLISDIYADSILVIAPLRLLWNIDISWADRSRLLLLFSSSVITTLSSLVHAYYLMRVGGMELLFVALIEVCASLLVCNLPVIVSLLLRIVDTMKYGRAGSQRRCKGPLVGGRFRGCSGGCGGSDRASRSLHFMHSMDTAIRVDLETVIDPPHVDPKVSAHGHP